ncbi:hypothetical protein KKC17_03985 [Patescibacteria group bacterium]|nr:hypothetical protein [Patescibacteria group bacterium]
MSNNAIGPTAKVATLNIPTKDTKITTSVWPATNGTLLVLFELNISPALAQDFVATLTQTIEKHWPQLSLQNLPADNLLEQLLAHLNFVLEAKKRLMGNPLAPRYHLAVALLQENNLALSIVGRVNALLITSDKINNLINQSGPTGKPISKPTFEQITSGRLEAGESFILASTCLLDYFSITKLQKTLNSQNPGAALRDIEKYINQLPHSTPLGIIALRFGSVFLPSGTAPSLDKLISTESATSQLLKPKLWQYLKNKLLKNQTKPIASIAPVKPMKDNLVSPEIINQPVATPTPVFPPKIKPNQGNILAKIKTFNKNLQKTLAKLIWLTSRETAKNTLANYLGHKIKEWRRLSLTKKITFILAVLLLTAFSTSIISLGRDRLNLKDSELYNELVTNLTEQQAGLEAALIYHDDDKAQNYLNEAENLLKQLPRNSSSRQAQYKVLQEHLTTLKNRLQRKADLVNLKKFSTLPQEQNWLGLNFKQNSLLSYSVQGQLYQTDNQGKTKKLFDLPTELIELKNAFITDNDGPLLFQGTNNKLALFNNLQSQVSLISNPPALLAATWYDGKLYYLDAELKTIFRSRPQGNNLNTARWLKASQGEITDGLAIGVDGSIYIITANDLKKYTSGLLNDFSLQQIDPPLQKLSQLWTQINNDYIFLLSRQDKRLIILNKQGQLIIQLYFPEINNLQDFTLDTKSQIIYLLDSIGSIYKIELAGYLS